MNGGQITEQLGWLQQREVHALTDMATSVLVATDDGLAAATRYRLALADIPELLELAADACGAPMAALKVADSSVAHFAVTRGSRLPPPFSARYRCAPWCPTRTTPWSSTTPRSTPGRHSCHHPAHRAHA
jgi:hypothetical protein